MSATSRSIRLTDLLPMAPSAGPANGAGGQSEVNGQRDEGDGSNPFRVDGRELSAYNHIFKRLQDHLIYPEELRTQGIRGNVTADIVFNAEGAYVPSATEIHSSDPYLRVHVLRTLRKAFQHVLPADLIKEKRRIALRCTFEFDITEHDDANYAASRNFVAGNRMTFYRYFQNSKLSWNLGPFNGWAVFPSMNLMWFYDKADQALSKKERVDPLSSYKSDPDW